MGPIKCSSIKHLAVKYIGKYFLGLLVSGLLFIRNLNFHFTIFKAVELQSLQAM